MSTTSVSRRPTPPATTTQSQPVSQANAAAPASSQPKPDAFGAQAAAPASQVPAPAKTLTSQVKDKLVSFLWSELGKEHTVDLAKVSLGEHGALGIRAGEQ